MARWFQLRRRAFGIVWIVLSVFWIDVTAEKVHELRIAEQAIGLLRYVNIAFWFVMLAFWTRFTWMEWRRGAKGNDSARD